jgi:hypothetical protein
LNSLAQILHYIIYLNSSTKLTIFVMSNNKNSRYMKTSILSFQNKSIYYIIGFLSVLVTSCGSYQNSSYYDSDGIYGNPSNRPIATNTQNYQNQYKDYFGSLQNESQSNEIFTDVDNYNDYNLEAETLNNDYQNYPGWGSNPQSVSINVYDTGWAMNNWYGNNWYGNGGFGWGMNNGFGYNNWYGNNWYGNGWGWNGGFGWGINAGFGYNNWYGNNWYGNGWGNTYYQNSRTTSYNPGRRGSSYTNSESSARNSGDYSRTQNNTINRRAVNSDYRGSTDSRMNRSNGMNRTSPTFSRNQGQQQNNSYSTPTRRGGDFNNARQENNTPSRSYSPASRSNDNSRSYSPSSNSSSRSSGNSGGGRSSGGGGRGGRG